MEQICYVKLQMAGEVVGLEMEDLDPSTIETLQRDSFLGHG